MSLVVIALCVVTRVSVNIMVQGLGFRVRIRDGVTVKVSVFQRFIIYVHHE